MISDSSASTAISSQPSEKNISRMVSPSLEMAREITTALPSNSSRSRLMLQSPQHKSHHRITAQIRSLNHQCGQHILKPDIFCVTYASISPCFCLMTLFLSCS